jgi:hypothetical protein
MRALKFYYLALIFTVLSCGKKEAKDNRSQLGPTLPIPQTEKPEKGFQLNASKEQAIESFYPEEKIAINDDSACQVWDSLEVPEVEASDSEVFQLLNTLSFDFDSIPIPSNDYTPWPPMPHNKYKKTYYPKGKIRPANVPHVLFMLSKESDDSNVKNLHTPPTASQVRDRLKNSDHWMDNFKAWWGSNNSLIGGRNAVIEELLEKLIPGVLSQKEGRLNGSKIFEDLHNFTGIKEFKPEHEKDLLRLTKRVHLFRSSSWYDREKELRKTLLILDRPKVSHLKLSEKVCHFALFHRLMAQLVSIKGVEGAPSLDVDGYLKTLPTINGDGIATESWPGLFQVSDNRGEDKAVILTEPWIMRELDTKNLQQSTLHLKNTKVPFEQLASIRYFTTLSSFRSPRLWKYDGLVPPCVDNRPCLPTKLLRMGIGLHAVLLNNFKKNWIDQSLDLAKSRLDLVPEQPSVLALLIDTVVESRYAFDDLRNSSKNPIQYKLDQLILTPDQMTRFNHPKTGCLKQYDDLSLILAIEAQYRLLKNTPHPRLQHALWRMLSTNDSN